MPDFYNRMKDKLRTVEQGADTIVWLAISSAAIGDDKNAGGLFFQVNDDSVRALQNGYLE